MQCLIFRFYLDWTKREGYQGRFLEVSLNFKDPYNVIFVFYQRLYSLCFYFPSYPIFSWRRYTHHNIILNDEIFNVRFWVFSIGSCVGIVYVQHIWSLFKLGLLEFIKWRIWAWICIQHHNVTYSVLGNVYKPTEVVVFLVIKPFILVTFVSEIIKCLFFKSCLFS